jgi:hypothetical protein
VEALLASTDEHLDTGRVNSRETQLLNLVDNAFEG